MSLKITKTHLWVNEILDEAGGLAHSLEPLTTAGADFDTVFARRLPDKPGSGVVFVTPLRGKKVLAAARQAGFAESVRIPALKLEGDDRPGLVQAISQAIGQTGVSLRGLHAAVIGRRCVVYAGFDSQDDATKSATAIQAMGRKGTK